MRAIALSVLACCMFPGTSGVPSLRTTTLMGARIRPRSLASTATCLKKVLKSVNASRGGNHPRKSDAICSRLLLAKSSIGWNAFGSPGRSPPIEVTNSAVGVRRPPRPCRCA